MSVQDYTKLLVTAIVMGGTIFLGYGGKIDSQAVVALLSAGLGYVFGNGHGILQAKELSKKVNP